MTEPAYLTPPEVARELRCRDSKVSGWIKSGQLPAVNVGEGTRPRYRVRRADLDEFLARRAVVPKPKPERRPRRDPAIPRYLDGELSR